MELLTCTGQVIVPVFLVVAIGYGFARRVQPEMGGFNRVVAEVSLLVYTALADKDVRWQDHVGCSGPGPC